jgi:hypothetical protein
MLDPQQSRSCLLHLTGGCEVDADITGNSKSEDTVLDLTNLADKKLQYYIPTVRTL